MDYLIEEINEEIVKLAKEIREEVPYWMHNRPVLALRKALKKCQGLEEIALDTTVLIKNRDIIMSCLNIFNQRY